VLVAVLWIVMALSIIVTGLTRSVRDEARMISAARQGVQASYLGDAAIQIVLQQLAFNAQTVERLVTLPVQFHGRTMEVQVAPLNGLIDVNSASAQLLGRLLSVAGGLADGEAAALAQAIVDFREQRTPQGLVRRFEALEDVMQVPGVTYDLYARLSGLATVDIRSSGKVNPMAAPAAVLQVLAGGDAQAATQIDGARQSGQASVDLTGLDGAFIGSGGVRRYRIQARVPVADGATYLITRFVDVNPRSRDGTSWTTFHALREVLPPPRTSSER
jgi:general secretion pathway protein K